MLDFEKNKILPRKKELSSICWCLRRVILSASSFTSKLRNLKLSGLIALSEQRLPSASSESIMRRSRKDSRQQTYELIGSRVLVYDLTSKNTNPFQALSFGHTKQAAYFVRNSQCLFCAVTDSQRAHALFVLAFLYSVL